MTESKKEQEKDSPLKHKVKTKAAAEKKTKVKTDKPRKSRRWPVFITFLVALAGVGGSYYLWQEFTALNQSFSYTLQQNADDMKRSHDALENSIEEVDDRIARLEQSVRAMQGKDNMDWLVSEAEYLMRIANHRLILERDVTSALTALKSADARLFETNDPYWIPVREQLARDINALDAVEEVDVAGLSVRLSALGNEIIKLPILKPDRSMKAENQSQQGGDKPPAKYWDEVWDDMKDRLGNLIVIRNVERPPGPLLEPEQAAYLQQNLLLKLEESKLALLRGQAESYRNGLKSMKTWIESYYDTGTPATREVLKHLTALHEIQIDPPLPDITSSLKSLEAAREKRYKAARKEAG